MAVVADVAAVDRLRAELERYDGDYRIVVATSGDDALAQLDALRADRATLALALADHWLPGTTGTAFLRSVGGRHPGAKRALLLAWGGWTDEPTAAAIRAAMAVETVDAYVQKPWRSPDEELHRTISELLSEWARASSAA